MKLRNALLMVVVVTFSGWVGYWLGTQKVRISFANWKPAIVVNKMGPSGASEQQQAVDFEHFWTVWDKVNQLYVDKDQLDAQKMVDGAIAGMVAAIGDPYTAYLGAQQNRESKEDLGGAFEGVGIQLGFVDSRLAVMAPLEGTPAKRSGIRAGDFILRIVDEKKKVDQEAEGLSLPEAVKLIRGPKGSKVKLTVLRSGVDEPWEVELVRDTIVVKSATVELLDMGEGKKVAWLKLARFGDRTSEEWAEAVSNIKSQATSPNIGGVVLDLRNNPGGYLDGAVYLAGEFLPAGKVVVEQQFGDGRKIDSRVARNGVLLKEPLVVLVNKGSASAAEILAGALQDHRRAKIVGVKSFGKGSVQQPEDFADGSGIHVTVAKWLRPSGEWIDQKGITPDVVVEWDNGDTSGDWTKDPQLVKAVEML